MVNDNNTVSVAEARGRLQTLGFTDADAELLRSMHGWAESAIPEFVRRFYDRSFQIPFVVEMVQRQNSSRERLEVAQASYAMALFRGWPDDAYLSQRLTVGRVHARIGITAEYYVASYQFYYDILFPMVREHVGSKKGKTEEAVSAIQKLLTLDQALVMDTYVENITINLRGLVNEVAAKLAVGDVDVRGAQILQDGDELGQSFLRIVDYVEEQARLAGALAEGDVAVDFQPKSDQDLLGMAFQRMVQSLQERASVAEAIAAGDLSVHVTARSDKDQLGVALAKMVGGLRDIVGQLSSTARTLTDASQSLSEAASQAGQATQGIASTGQQLAKGAEDQAHSVNEATRAVNSLNAAIEQIARGSKEQANSVEQASTIVNQVSNAAGDVARNAQEAADGARQTSDAARGGSDAVHKTTEGMDRIRDAVASASSRIEELGQHSAEIGKIVAVIDDIAAQTNLLALNAAIEAARAGEQGRGFAVVADEVRKLAERVTEATKEIAGLIETVQRGVDESIRATEEGGKEVATGTQLADEAGDALKSVLQAVEAVAGQIEQISAAAEEVSASSDEMVRTIDTVSSVAEQNAAAAQEMKTNSADATKTIEAVAGVTEESSAATQEMSSASAEMSAQVDEVVRSAQSLAGMAGQLERIVDTFRLAEEAPAHAGAAEIGPGATTSEESLPLAS